ncbi:hypothetical protein DFH07DRAFT_955745 [Mycena maculata]|uniref:F-box domain-containing protein n=1 Tax=Mycena maculata TaxID=230809 RepID=A0AAD7JJZ7_9AGAR|nr:hypothetical protein DFH07DRAFT_955745 [Mycena maculata]
MVTGPYRSTILDLPFELVFHVLELNVSAYDLRHHCTPDHEYRYLCGTALVSKAWATPSQTLLWRYISLRNPSQARRWIDSPATGQYTTLGLSIYGWKIEDAVLRRVLSKTIGLRTLALSSFQSISGACFALPELKNLTALVLRHCTVSAEGTTSFCFRLRLFQTFHTCVDPAVIKELFRASASTLKFLEVEEELEQHNPTLQGLYESFPRVAATIRALRITKPYNPLVPLLAGCTALKRLELTDDVGAALAAAICEALPTPLADLSVVGRPHGVHRVLDGILQAFPLHSLSQLKHIYLHWKHGLVEESMRDIFRAHNIREHRSRFSSYPCAFFFSLEEFIPDEYFPDILYVNDPDDSTAITS